MFRASAHAAQRYQERFVGNVTQEVARQRLEKIAKSCRFKGPLAGGAKLYGTGDVRIVVRNGTILTTYPARPRVA